MPNARLTVKAMEKYLNETESKSIINTWDLTTPSDLYNKDVVLYTIMKRGGSLEVLEYDPDLFYTDCAMFWAKWRRTVEKWVNALNITYNPLENYDRMEDSTDLENANGGKTSTRSITETIEGDTSNTRTLNTSTDTDGTVTDRKTGTETTVVDGETTTDVTTDEKVSAFDSSDYEPSKQTIVDGEGTEDTTTTVTYNTTNTNTTDTTVAESGTITDVGTDDKTITTSETLSDEDTGNKTNTHTARLHGNIGVTTSQAMLQAELELQYWNLYDHIADLFIGEMTTRVY